MPHQNQLFAGRYRVSGLLGQGGMGIVLDAEDMATGREVAIKVLRDSLADHQVVRARFAREARVLTELTSAHVVRGIERGDVDGLPYVAMERLDGVDLADVLSIERRLPVGAAVALARQICAALADVHALGVVHRDIKPENLFLLRDDDGRLGQRLKLLDFGIAKIAGAPRTDTPEEQVLADDQASMGTTVYMAPEQFRTPPEVGERADLWAVGIILYELLTGRLPFEGSTRGQTMMRVLGDDAPPPSAYDAAIPAELDRIVMRCLRRDPADRFRSAEDLDTSLAPLTLVGSTWSPKERTPRASLVRVAAARDRRRRTTARVA